MPLMVCLRPQPNTQDQHVPAQCPDAAQSMDRQVPRAPSHVRGVTLHAVVSSITSVGLTLPSTLLRTHAPDQCPPADFGFPIRRVFAGCRCSLLDNGPSRHYLCNPCMGAGTPTPWHPFGAFARFFPKNCGLTPGTTGSACQTSAAMQLQRREAFRGCSHSFMFRLPYLLDPPAAPTTGPLCAQGGRTVYTTHSSCGYPTSAVASLRACIGQLARLDSHQLDCSLVGRSSSPASKVVWDAPTPCRPSRRTSLPSLGGTTPATAWRRQGLPGSWRTLTCTCHALRPRWDRCHQARGFRWRVSIPTLSIAGRVHISTIARDLQRHRCCLPY